MAKPKISAEWTILDSEAEWKTIQTKEFSDQMAKAQTARFGARWREPFGCRHIWWATAVAALLVLAVAGAWAWRTAQTGLNQIDGELNAAVGQELWAIEEGKVSLAADLATGSQNQVLHGQLKRDYEFLQEATASTSTAGEMVADMEVTDVEIVRRHKELAVVRVVVEIGEEKYRQTRFYRRTSEGWLLTLPELSLLGEWRLLRTEYFSIGHYDLYARDVAEAAPRLDAFAAQLRADIGLSSVAGLDRYAIEIGYGKDSFEHTLATKSSGQNNNIFRLTSPLSRFLPAAISDSEAIVQSAELQLAYPMVQEAIVQRDKQWGSNARRWEPILSALSLWEFWESGTPLAKWKHEIVEMGMKRYTYPDDAPAHYEDICHAYRVWSFSPRFMSIPLNCESLPREPYLTLEMPDTLHGLLAPGSECCEPEELAIPEAHVVGLTTVLHYAVATYGRERLPVLINTLGEHETWDTLIPAVFGVTVEEFEAGWQIYLTDKYDS